MSPLLSRAYDRMRDPQSHDAAAAGATTTGFDALRGHKYCLLVSYRRSGEPVPTPVWFGFDGAGLLYVHTEADSGKVKRIRADPRVLVGPANARGRPLGPLAAGTARLLDPGRHAEADRAVQSNYGAGRRIYEALFGSRHAASAYLEVTPS